MAGFDAVGTYHHAFGLTVLKRPNRLKIGVEASFVDIMRMANVVANHRFFPTDLTFSGHFYNSPSIESYLRNTKHGNLYYLNFIVKDFIAAKRDDARRRLDHD
jgi:hypothetical protein